MVNNLRKKRPINDYYDICCVHCNTNMWVKKVGWKCGKQRFLCNSCKRGFGYTGKLNFTREKIVGCRKCKSKRVVFVNRFSKGNDFYLKYKCNYCKVVFDVKDRVIKPNQIPCVHCRSARDVWLRRFNKDDSRNYYCFSCKRTFSRNSNKNDHFRRKVIRDFILAKNDATNLMKLEVHPKTLSRWIRTRKDLIVEVVEELKGMGFSDEQIKI